MDQLKFFGLVVPYLIACQRDRTNALVGACILLPYNQWLPPSGIPFLTIHTVVVLALLWSLMRRNPDWPLNKPPRPTAPIALGVFGLFLTIGFLLGHMTEIPLKYADLWDARRLLQIYREKLSVIFICYAAFKLTDSAETMKRAFFGCLIGFGAETVFCFAEFLLRSSKVTGHLEAKNATGAFLATYAGVAFGVFLASPWMKRRILFAGLAGCATLATLGTRSRGGVLAISTTLLLSSLLKNRAVFVLLIVAAATSPFWMPEATLEKFQEAVYEGDEGDLELTTTASERIEIWIAGFNTIPDYPMGVGLGNFKMIVPTYGLEHKLWWAAKDAHNEFVLVAVELGIPAVLTYLFLLGGNLLRAWRVSGHDPDPWARSIAFGTIFGLLGGAAASMMLSLILRSDISGVMWILMGMCARRSAELSVKRVPARRPTVVSVTSRPETREMDAGAARQRPGGA
jgi:O-antigen ligase